MEKQLNSSAYFPRIYVIADSSRDPRMICESGRLNLKNSHIGSSSCQCSTILIGQKIETMGVLLQTQKRSRHTRRDSRRDTGRSQVLETKRNGMELSVIHLKEMGFHSISDGGTTHRNRSSSVQEYQCVESWNSEKEEKQRPQRGCFEHRALIQIILYLRSTFELV